MKRFRKFFLLGMLMFCRILLWYLKTIFNISFINEDLYTYINCGLIAVFTVLMVVYFLRKKSAKIAFVIVGLILILLCFYINELSYVLSSRPNYYYFSSPEGDNTLLLEESENITGCTVRGYKVVCLILVLRYFVWVNDM